MKLIKNILFIVLGFVAWMAIGISDRMLESKGPLGTEDFVYAAVLVLSVVYFHCMLRRFVLPLQGLPKDTTRQVRDAYVLRYAKGFLAGTIGWGYVLLFFHVFALLDRNVSGKPSFLPAALFFIALGVLAQARAVIQYFCSMEGLRKKQPVEP